MENSSPICISNISVHKDNTVLLDLSRQQINLPCNTFFCLIGENGAGKSTLIKSVLNFNKLTTGNITLFGKPSTDCHARDNIAYLPEKVAPPHYMSGLEYLRFTHQCHVHPTSEKQDQTDKQYTRLCHQLGLSQAALKKPIKKLSKGMEQKLALISILLSKKKLLLLDEPFSGLDPRARIIIQRELLRLKHETDTTVFFTSHRLTDLVELADSMAVLHEGQILFIGKPEELIKNTQTSDLESAFLKQTQACEP